MAPSYLKPQQKIYVFKQNSQEQYVSSIESTNSDEVTIALPLSHSSSLHAKVGDHLTVRLPSDTHSVEFTTRVIRLKIDNIPLYVLKYPEEIKRIQLRQHVRLSLLLDVMNSVAPESGEAPVYKKAMMLNISAGGMKLSVADNIPEGSLLLVKFALQIKGTDHEFELEATVVRSQAVDSQKQKLYHLGLCFTKVTNMQKDLIYQFIFNKMAELRRDGKA